ncbi:PD-(D/E)XK nuclease family protein [Chitinophaga sp.]|uniref:PD-(D/E)XK nuclease family protein n=1 Tax=Chitinophaga sp. TaxID=1869181 RepID=UPI0031DCA1FE
MKSIFHNPDNQQINFLDKRYYTKDNVNYYPSVTTVLEALPKGWALEQWKKDLGHNADLVLERAAKEGSNVHDAIESYLGGAEVRWQDEKTGNSYNLTEWTSILRFVDFWETYQPELIANEMNIISDTYRLGGTIDIVCRIAGQLWLIDAKTSNSIYDSMELQLSAYATMWNEVAPEKIERTGILHLKAQTRGADKTGKKIQGLGWQLKEFDRHYSQAWQSFQLLRGVWDECNPDYKPANLTLPDRVKLKRTA